MIKRQEGYVLKEIGGIHRLLPFGQKVADQRKGISMNETGVFLWNALKEPKEETELTELTACYYEITDDKEKEMLKHDIHGFLNQMQALGILRTELRRKNETCCGKMQIAGMRIGFFGDAELIPEEFNAFRMADTDREVHQEWDQQIELIEGLPESTQNGRTLLKNKELVVSAWEEGYILQFPTLDNVYESYMTEDGSYVRIHCRKPCREEEKDNLFHAIRQFFLYLAQKKGYYAIHSASILYKGKAWLFSGHSGMGKSTHTAMWHEIEKTPYLNGDLNLAGIREEDNRLVISGIPWCGTSQIYTTEEYEFGGIVLLGRDTMDHVETLTEAEKTIKVMQRMISPVWKEEMLEKNLAFAEKIAEKVPILQLFCTKEPEAVKVIKREIDRLEVIRR